MNATQRVEVHEKVNERKVCSFRDSPVTDFNGDQSHAIQLLQAAYAAFNARDIDAALATMTADVAWPKAFEGGFVEGGEAIREYWTRQWSGINPHVEPVAFHPDDLGRILVDVHQVVRDLEGEVVDDRHVGHRYTFEGGLIQRMDVSPLET